MTRPTNIVIELWISLRYSTKRSVTIQCSSPKLTSNIPGKPKVH